MKVPDALPDARPVCILIRSALDTVIEVGGDVKTILKRVRGEEVVSGVRRGHANVAQDLKAFRAVGVVRHTEDGFEPRKARKRQILAVVVVRPTDSDVI